MAYSDRELLARLIQCEAGGEGEDGMKAVAGVVMNRVHAKGGEYARVGQGSIRNIIFQPYQFVCASETEGGAYNPQNIYNMRPEQIHYDIADWAIAGNRLPDVADSLWFYNGGNGAPPVAQVAPRMTDWSGEVTPMPADPPMPEAPGRTVTSAGRPMDRLNAAEEQGGQSMGSLDMRNHLPSEVITDPISMEEAYRGSLKAMLKKNVGNYVVATFLVGTQSTTSWEGILYDVGNDYMTIYQEGRDRYIVSDIYSLKFIEFYDTRCRDICDEVLRSGWMPNQGM